ncbi:hypothetical protein JK164_08075 [Gluconobacter kondonii]|uniref:hypothetical protein n=1 Tax=Gluconobacter kondonii TaxID=941463 RepID=UPI001B8C02B8|nr:hypothetical protein [Gluconobacter kondonii]MBS1065915.1 hypothetical protein [Gluconobacter kondonii]
MMSTDFKRAVTLLKAELPTHVTWIFAPLRQEDVWTVEIIDPQLTTFSHLGHPIARAETPMDAATRALEMWMSKGRTASEERRAIMAEIDLDRRVLGQGEQKPTSSAE